MRSRAALVFFLAVVTAALIGACAAVLGFEDTTLRSGDATSADDGNPENDGNPNDGMTLADGAPSRLTTTPSSIAVRRGGSTTVKVDIERGGDVTGDVTIELTGLPAGVSAMPVKLAAADSSGSLTVTATKMATLGAAANVKLQADGTSLAPSPIPLLVEDPPGTLDQTFDADGLVFDISKGLTATFYAIAVQSDANIVAGGGGGTTAGWLLRRFGPAGVPDSAFITAQGAGLPTDGAIHGLGVDSKGRIVCVGSSLGAAAVVSQLTVVRLTKTGALDATFNGTGIVRAGAMEFPLGSEGLGLAIAADDSIVVSGSRTTATGTNGVLVRVNATGVRDSGFGTAGVAEVPSARLVGVSIDATGAIYAGGTSTTGPSLLLTKRLATGTPDNAFATAGISTFGMTYEANGFARLATGDFLYAGDVGGSAYMVAAARADGGTFIFQRALSTVTGATLYGVAGLDTTSFVVAGHTAVPNGEARVERVGIDGLPITSFGTQGIELIEDGGPGDAFDVTLFAAAVQADGRILVAGNRSNVGAALYRLWQ